MKVALHVPQLIAVCQLLFLRSHGFLLHPAHAREEQDADACPVPGELLGLSHFPTLHTGPYSKNPWRLREQYTAQITDDDGATWTNLFGPTSPVAFFAVRNNRLYQLGGDKSPVKSNFDNFAQELVHAFNRRGSMHSGDFCFDATDNDAFIKEKLLNAELYCASQITWLPAIYPVVAVPNDYFERSLFRDTNFVTIPWEEKVPKIYWRGGLTGTPDMYSGRSSDPFFNIPRVAAYQLAQRYPKMMDFGFVHIDDQLTVRYMHGKKSQEQASFIGGIKLAPETDFQKELPRFKYLLNVDGIVVAWRLRELLMSGSVVFQFVGKTAEFFFRDLKPWEHYVPVHDLEDIPKFYRKLEADPKLARRIAKAGKAFADKRLTVEGQDCYISRFMEFVGNRTGYELASPEALKDMGFVEIDSAAAKAGFLQKIRD